MSAPATATGSRQALSICITASCSSPSPHWRYLTGSLRGGDGAFSRALASSPRRIRNDCLHFLFQPDLDAAGEDEFADEIGRPPGGFTQRDTETDKMFDVHCGNQSSRYDADCFCLALISGMQQSLSVSHHA